MAERFAWGLRRLLVSWTLVTDLIVPVDLAELTLGCILVQGYEGHRAVSHVVQNELGIHECVTQNHLFSLDWLLLQ